MGVTAAFSVEPVSHDTVDIEGVAIAGTGNVASHRERKGRRVGNDVLNQAELTGALSGRL